MRKAIAMILSLALTVTGLAPCLSAAAVTQKIVYKVIECVDAEDSTADFFEQKYNDSEGYFSRFDATKLGDEAVYVIDVAAAGEYDLTIRYRAHESTSKSNDVYVNGQKTGTSFNQTGNANSVYNASMGKVTLSAGKNTLKIISTSASSNGSFKLNIFSFTISYDDGTAPEIKIPMGTVGGDTGSTGTLSGTDIVYNAISSEKPEYSSAAFVAQTTGAYTFSRFDATDEGAYASYAVNVSAAGKYKLIIRYRSHESVGKAYFYLNGVKQEKVFKSTGAANGYYQVDMGIYDFSKGDNYIQFYMYEAGTSGTYRLNIVDFTLGEPTEEDMNGYIETPGASSDKVVSYPFQSIYDRSEIFSVKADGVDIPVIAYNSDWYDYSQFSFKDKEQPVTIEITYYKDITSYSISPLKLGLDGTALGNKLTFTLSDSQYLIIKLNGSNKRLVLTADPPETDIPASSGEGIFNVSDAKYGADKSGKESSWKAIQNAIDDASDYGSTEGNSEGIVYVPSGVYFVGNLMLDSNVKFYLEGGAILRASKNEEDFTARGRKNSLGLPITYLISTEFDSTNIKIYGRGTVDGDGYNVRGLGFAIQTLSPINTSYFTTDGITYRDSGMWSIVPAWSDHLNFLNIKILNTVKLGEDDGIDVCGCQDVLVQHAIGIMWDDPFSTKAYDVGSGEIAGGWGSGPSEINDNIKFDDCVSWTGCYGFKAGQGFIVDQQNISFTNGTVYECAAGIGIHHKQGGAKCDNVTFDNIDIESIPHQNDDHKTWCVLYIQAASGTGGPITNVTIKNINVRCSSTSTPKLLGKADDVKISNASFENITFKGSTGAATTLKQMGFTDDYMKFSENCYVINPDNAKTPAEYYSAADAAAVVSDSAAETAQALSTTGGKIQFDAIDFGESADLLNVRYLADTDAEIKVALDTADNIIGTIGATETAGEYGIGSVILSGVTGTHNVYLICDSAAKIDWIQPYDNAGDNQNDADRVAELIGAIGEITYPVSDELRAAVTAARIAYDELGEGAKALISEAALSPLCDAEGQITEYDAAEAVETLIAAIGTVSAPATDEQEAAVAAARSAYDQLNDIQKALVRNLTLLEKAESDIKTITGDMDGDGKITVSDVVELRKIIMSGNPDVNQLKSGDINADGMLTVSDVVALRQKIMNG